MNTERLEERMEDKYERRGIKSDKGHLWTGAALLIIGGLFLAREAGILFPRWFFTWPMILVGIGLFTGIRHRFNNPVPFILLIIGGIFLADEISPDFTLKQYVGGGRTFIINSTKDGNHLALHIPVGRYNDLGASKHIEAVNHHAALDVGLRQVQFSATENSYHVAA